MTKQEIFDTAVSALLKQGKRSTDGGGFCMFRSPNGNKCAVGHLIPDEDYDPLMDVTATQNGLGNRHTLTFIAERLGVDYGFLKSLQVCHDGARHNFIPEFTAAAKIFAQNWNLQYDHV